METVKKYCKFGQGFVLIALVCAFIPTIILLISYLTGGLTSHAMHLAQIACIVYVIVAFAAIAFNEILYIKMIAEIKREFE
jgi:hypothetical protein